MQDDLIIEFSIEDQTLLLYSCPKEDSRVGVHPQDLVSCQTIHCYGDTYRIVLPKSRLERPLLVHLHYVPRLLRKSAAVPRKPRKRKGEKHV